MIIVDELYREFNDDLKSTILVLMVVITFIISHSESVAKNLSLSNMQIVGVITGSPEPSIDDVITVVNPVDGRLVGTGAVIDTSGTYFIELSTDNSLDGTNLTLMIQMRGKTYLLRFGSNNNTFQFVGSFPFPNRQTIPATIGSIVSIGNTDIGSSTANPIATTEFQDFTDPTVIAQTLSRYPVDLRADFNKDGVVNTRDVIDAIRARRVNPMALTQSRVKIEATISTTSTGALGAIGSEMTPSP